MAVQNSRTLLRAFGGLNETYGCTEAEYSAGMNFSARNFPALSTRTPRRKLREADGLLRQRLFAKSATKDYDTVGADVGWQDGLRDDVPLLAPAPFDALYPHYLCAKLDAALGETERYAGEQARYNSILAELSAWLRRRAKPKRGAQWRW